MRRTATQLPAPTAPASLVIKWPGGLGSVIGAIIGLNVPLWADIFSAVTDRYGVGWLINIG